jgi:hypothetical protein
MRSKSVCFSIVIYTALSCWSLAWGQSPEEASNSKQPVTKLPQAVIPVRGAWASASDSVTPMPENGSVAGNILHNPYFDLTYALPPDWTQKYEGPPPSDSGRYVLAQITPAESYKGPTQANILVTAQDMFFAPMPASNAFELIDYSRNNLPPQYRLESEPSDIKIAGHSFRFFSYGGPVSQLHWYIAATEVRCHTLEFVLTSRDTKLLDGLIADLSRMTLPAEAGPTTGSEGGDFPLCIKDYARDENLVSRVEPTFTERRFNPIPVRIIIDREGTIRHIHFLRAFPEQAKAITDALGQWKFRPYVKDGHPIEVETGILFGRGLVMSPSSRREVSNASGHSANW